MTDFPKLDVTMLDNWLRGCHVTIDGTPTLFPDGRAFFALMLCGERIKLERRASAAENARLRALTDEMRPGYGDDERASQQVMQNPT